MGLSGGVRGTLSIVRASNWPMGDWDEYVVVEQMVGGEESIG